MCHSSRRHRPRYLRKQTTHIHTELYSTSYSHLRGCWFSEMPQVRCHVHTPNLDLSVFSWQALLLSIYRYLFSHKRTFMWLYLRQFFSPQPLFSVAERLLLGGLTKLVPYFSLSVITERSHRYWFEQQHFMKTIQYLQSECAGRRENVHLIISELRFPVGERERRVIA